jgi:hypothetical protein
MHMAGLSLRGHAFRPDHTLIQPLYFRATQAQSAIVH